MVTDVLRSRMVKGSLRDWQRRVWTKMDSDEYWHAGRVRSKQLPRHAVGFRITYEQGNEPDVVLRWPEDQPR